MEFLEMWMTLIARKGAQEGAQEEAREGQRLVVPS